MAIDYISLAVLISVFCFYFLRQIAQIKMIKTEQAILLISLVAIGVILIVQVLMLGDKIGVNHFQKIINPSLAVIFSSYLTLVSLLAIPGEAQSKQVKTLWRIPIIGLMAGIYFELNYISYICLGNILLSIGICYKGGTNLRYLLVKVWPLSIPVFLMLFVRVENLLILNVILFLCVVFGKPLLNMANIHGMIHLNKV